MGEITEHERLFGLIFSLCVLNQSQEIDIARQYLCDRLHKSERTINYWVQDMVEEGVISVDVKRGRGARCTYKLNAQTFARFLDDKMRNTLHINAQVNAQTVAQFSGLSRTLSNSINVENKFNNKYNNSSFDAERAKSDDEEEKEKFDLFKEDEILKTISEDSKRRFTIWWQKFNCAPEFKNRYKAAMAEFAQMSEQYQAAAIKVISKYGHWSEPNPYYYIQHFAPIFLNGREQYRAYKAGSQLVRVRWNDEQPITTPDIADWFGLEVLDAHFERGFEN